jgi:VIT1/CCC1 family predicted Fe2+/Mn2+ transporter
MSRQDIGQAKKASLRKWQALLDSERDAAALYERLADADSGERSRILRELASVERRHAAHWESKLRAAGADVAPRSPVSLRTRLLGRIARHWSAVAVLPLVERMERSDAGVYDEDPDAAPWMAFEERGHARTLTRLRQGNPDARQRIARRERWHRGDRSGALRAAVFGLSDGLVSNTALVLGVAGSGAHRTTILLAGVAGLLAGSFSMAAGEYVSMAGQREMYEREIGLEAHEIEEDPQSEHEELVLIYRAKGLNEAEATRVADTVMADQSVALDTMAREELGLDPEELGSPWTATVSSLITFGVGALVVLLPYFVTTGTGALVAAAAMFLAGLCALGAGIGLLNGRSAWRSAARQIAVGGLAATVTFAVGHLIGTAVS